MSSPLRVITDQEWLLFSNHSLGIKHNATPATVGQYRRIHGKPKGPRSPGSGRPQKYDLSRIDWSLTTTANAERLGCSPAYITLLRRKHTDTNTDTDTDFA